MDTAIKDLVLDYLMRIPVFLAIFVGLILCLVFWSRHPRGALLTLLALLLDFFVRLIMPLAYWKLPSLFSEGSGPDPEVVARILTFLEFSADAVVWFLVLGAIFTGRTPRQTAQRTADAQPAGGYPPGTGRPRRID